MDKALYVGMSGALQTFRAQTANANNLANASTTGFRAERLVGEARAVGGEGFSTRFNAAMEDSRWDSSGGPIQDTGRSLDIAMRENHWLAVQSPDGSEGYTRAGDLQIDAYGRLLTGAGHPVMGDAGPIAIPPASSVSIAADGTVSVVPIGQGPEAQATVGRIKTAEAMPEQLRRGEDGLMRSTDGLDLPAAAGDTLSTGMLEGSNVNVAEAMVNMISLARQFEVQTKLMQTAESNAEAAASLVRMG